LAGRSPRCGTYTNVRLLDRELTLLKLGQQEFDYPCGRDDAATAWNFGPSDDDTRPVSWIVDKMLAAWDSSCGWEQPSSPQPHEAVLLRLDSSKARSELGWKPKLNLNEALTKIVDWHKHVDRGGDAREISLRQIDDYMAHRAEEMSKDQWCERYS